MNTNRNTDQLFEHMRKMPVEVPLENVEKFVIAQAALGITAVAASKGIFTKAFLTFHLNSIIIMTSTIAASIVGIFLWTTHGDKTAAIKNLNANPEFEYTSTFIPKIEPEADTPKTVTTKTVKDGEAVSVTTIETENGTKIKIVNSNNNKTAVYYNTTSDSNYVFAYASADKPAIPPISPVPPMFNLAPMHPPVRAGCCPNDSLTSLLQKTLLKDGLISDSSAYSFKINGTSLQVNGKKQSAEQWKKYKEIIEKNSDYKIHHFFIFTINKDELNVSVSVNDPMEPMQPIEPMEPMMPLEPMQPLPTSSFKSCNDTLMTKIEKSLLKDGLISDTLHYSFKINGSYMKVNGKKMSKEQWKKYKEIIETNSKNKINRSFSYAISRNDDDTSINVENFVD